MGGSVSLRAGTHKPLAEARKRLVAGMLRTLSQPRITTEGSDLVAHYGTGGLLPFVALAAVALALAAWLWLKKGRKMDAGFVLAFALIILAVAVPGVLITTVRISPT